MAHPNRKGTVIEPSVEPSGRASRLPLDWTVPEEWLAWATGEQPTWNPAHARHVSLLFHGYWAAKPGKDGLKLDWFLTWKTWVRKEKPLAGSGPRKAQTSFTDLDYRKGLNDDGSF